MVDGIAWVQASRRATERNAQVCAAYVNTVWGACAKAYQYGCLLIVETDNSATLAEVWRNMLDYQADKG